MCNEPEVLNTQPLSKKELLSMMNSAWIQVLRIADENKVLIMTESV